MSLTYETDPCGGSRVSLQRLYMVSRRDSFYEVVIRVFSLFWSLLSLAPTSPYAWHPGHATATGVSAQPQNHAQRDRHGLSGWWKSLFVQQSASKLFLWDWSPWKDNLGNPITGAAGLRLLAMQCRTPMALPTWKTAPPSPHGALSFLFPPRKCVIGNPLKHNWSLCLRHVAPRLFTFNRRQP